MISFVSFFQYKLNSNGYSIWRKMFEIIFSYKLVRSAKQLDWPGWPVQNFRTPNVAVSGPAIFGLSGIL